MTLLLLAMACAPDQGFYQLDEIDTFTQSPSSEVDILFVIDDSNSMAEEQGRMARGFEAFVASLEETNAEFHVGVTSTDMDLENPDRGALIGEPAYLTPDDDYVTLFNQRVTLGTEGSRSERGLAAAVEALTEPMASSANAGFLRPDADLLVVVVSDEDDCSDDYALVGSNQDACYTQREALVPVLDLVADLESVKAGTERRALFSGIVIPSQDEACGDAQATGRRYIRAADATGGLVGDICDDDYSGIMEELGLSVAGLLSNFRLDCDPVEDTLVVEVDGEIIEPHPVTGWTFDSVNRMLRFDGDYLPPRGSTLTASYKVGGECGGELTVEPTAEG
ncbi:MAG: VWA domain-containing protein [Alphaproteobacteria bacterium]|nr:VWA domain-containing protein [Alphaproteobacteria bacterium]